MLEQYNSRRRQSGGYPVFVGRSYQRGSGFGSVMSSIFRNFVVPAAKDVGKSLLKTGLRKASNVMRGVADGKNIGKALTDEMGISRTKPKPKPSRVTKRRKPNQQRKRPAKRRKLRQKDIFD